MSEHVLSLFPDKVEWSVQTMRLLAEGRYGGADWAEVERTANALSGRTWQDWAQTWSELATAVARTADHAREAGHGVTARDFYLRASNYARHGDFFVPPGESMKDVLYDQCVTTFQNALPYLPNVERVEVPFEGSVLDGYLCMPEDTREYPVATVIFLGGADSLAEELYFLGGPPLAERNIAALMIDTPGRGSALRRRGIVSRADYEVPVGAIVDWVGQREDLDEQRIGLWGLSLGGYYAPRAAGHLPQVQALSCWGGCYDALTDIYEYYEGLVPIMQWLTGARDDEDARRILKDFTLEDAAHRISCPVQILHAVGDQLVKVEGARRLYDEVAARDKELHVLEDPQKGGYVHCHWDDYETAMPMMADWLADKLQATR